MLVGSDYPLDLIALIKRHSVIAAPLRRSRVGGNPCWRLWITAYAGMTALKVINESILRASFQSLISHSFQRRSISRLSRPASHVFLRNA
jgi:hypothetical protein